MQTVRIVHPILLRRAKWPQLRGLAVVLVIGIVLAPAPSAQEFEVASVKPSPDQPPSVSLGSPRLPPGRWRGVRLNLVTLIGVAYPEYGFEGRVVGGPAWVREAQFDIDARMDPTTTPAQMAPMMAQLLADRFALRTHIEQRAANVYVLKMARSDGQLGPQLKRSAAICVEAKTAKQPLPPECRGLSGSGMNVPVSQVAEFLQVLSSFKIDRPVLDRTGLTGYFDFQIGYGCGPFNGVFGRSCDAGSVSFFTALQEQTGLKLEPAREVLDVLVIDSAKIPEPD